MPHRISSKLLCFLSLFAHLLGAQQPKAPVCSGLEARLSRLKEASNAYVGLGFILRNTPKSDCNDTFPESWELVLDGKPVPDSGMIFGNGPAPSGGYTVLKAGESFAFGKAFPVTRFKGSGPHKLFWRASEFQSNTIEVVTVEVEE